MAARRNVTETAATRSPAANSRHSSPNTVAGDGSSHGGFQPLRTTSSQAPRAIARATSFGHPASTIRRKRGVRRRLGISSVSRPANRVPSWSTAPASASGLSGRMPANLFAELLADRDRERGDLRRLDPSLAADHHREFGDRPTRPARQQHDALAEPDRLADVVGNEQDRQPGIAPDPLELLVEEVAGDRIERAERLVEQEDSRLLGEGPGERDALAHAAGQLVRPLPGKAREVDEIEEVGHGLAALPAGDAAEAQGELDIFGGRQPREEGCLLEDECRSVAIDLDESARGSVQAGDDVEERALAAARGTDEADEAADVDGQVEPVERDDGIGTAPEDLGDTF